MRTVYIRLDSAKSSTTHDGKVLTLGNQNESTTTWWAWPLVICSRIYKYVLSLSQRVDIKDIRCSVLIMCGYKMSNPIKHLLPRESLVWYPINETTYSIAWNVSLQTCLPGVKCDAMTIEIFDKEMEHSIGSSPPFGILSRKDNVQLMTQMNCKMTEIRKSMKWATRIEKQPEPKMKYQQSKDIDMDGIECEFDKYDLTKVFSFPSLSSEYDEKIEVYNMFEWSNDEFNKMTRKDCWIDPIHCDFDSQE